MTFQVLKSFLKFPSFFEASFAQVCDLDLPVSVTASCKNLSAERTLSVIRRAWSLRTKRSARLLAEPLAAAGACEGSCNHSKKMLIFVSHAAQVFCQSICDFATLAQPAAR